LVLDEPLFFRKKKAVYGKKNIKIKINYKNYNKNSTGAAAKISLAN
jgi:hypothetical protein